MKSRVLVVLGFFFLAIGIIGVVLPLLPTTPFLLLAAYFFDRGSPKFHHWLLSHKHFGPPILDWKNKGCIRLPYKILATAMMIFASSFVLLNDKIPLIGKIVYSATLIIVSIFIWTRPHK